MLYVNSPEKESTDGSLQSAQTEWRRPRHRSLDGKGRWKISEGTSRVSGGGGGGGDGELGQQNLTTRIGKLVERVSRWCHVPKFPFPVFRATAHYGSYWWSLRWPRTFVNALRSQNGGNSDATAVPRFFKILKVCYSRLYFLYFYIVAFKLGPPLKICWLYIRMISPSCM